MFEDGKYVADIDSSAYGDVVAFDGLNGDDYVHTNIFDMLRWDRVLREGKVLTLEEQNLMYTPAKLNSGEDAVYDEYKGMTLGYGFGWGTGRDKALGLIVSHSGGMPGVATWFERFIDADAERYSVQELEYDGWEKITVYGVREGSSYVPGVRTGEVVLSDGFMEKYGVRAGDTLALSDPYDGKDYSFRVGGSYHYPAAMSVFLSEEDFNKTFDREAGSFNGWFSNRKLTDLPEEAIATTITQSDLTVMADQLDDSMGFMFPLFCGFGFIIYVLMIYLLAKMIIDRNARSISMLKIMGYHDGEAGLLYNRATALVTAISLLLAIPLTVLLIKQIYYAMMKEYAGWLTFYVAPWVYPVSFAFGAVGFALVTLLLMRRVRKIPLSIALKTLE